MHIPQVMNVGHLHVLTCRCTPVFLVLGTAGQIALKFGVSLETNYVGVLREPRLGYTCRVYPFPCLGNSWTHCAEIWYVGRGAH